MRFTLLLSLLVLIALGTFSCGDDDVMVCPENNDLGEFFLAESSKDLYPYGDENITLIFSDSLGNEFKGQYLASDYTMCFTESQYSVDQNDPDSESCEFNYSGECRNTLLFFEDLDSLEIRFRMGISVSLMESLEHVQFDVFNVILIQDGIQLNDEFQNFDGQLAFNIEDLMTPDNSNIFYKFENDFNLHDRTYKDVYSSNIDFFGLSEPFDLHYSNEIGLVGFESEDKSISLKFERVE